MKRKHFAAVCTATHEDTGLNTLSQLQSRVLKNEIVGTVVPLTFHFKEGSFFLVYSARTVIE